jgi:hypothetical protein
VNLRLTSAEVNVGFSPVARSRRRDSRIGMQRIDVDRTDHFYEPGSRRIVTARRRGSGLSLARENTALDGSEPHRRSACTPRFVAGIACRRMKHNPASIGCPRSGVARWLQVRWSAGIPIRAARLGDKRVPNDRSCCRAVSVSKSSQSSRRRKRHELSRRPIAMQAILPYAATAPAAASAYRCAFRATLRDIVTLERDVSSNASLE